MSTQKVCQVKVADNRWRYYCEVPCRSYTSDAAVACLSLGSVKPHARTSSSVPRRPRLDCLVVSTRHSFESETCYFCTEGPVILVAMERRPCCSAMWRGPHLSGTAVENGIVSETLPRE